MTPRPALLLPLLVGCAQIGVGPRPVVDGPGFFDRPWPSDTRLVDGRPDLTGYPGAEEYSLVADYAAQAALLDGFGTASPIYLQLDGALAVTELPEPRESMGRESPLLLVNVDRTSPRRGVLVPFTWSYNIEETDWMPADLLTVQPVWGAPLEPSTTYALVLTRELAQPPRGFEEVWEPDHPEHALYEPVAETLFQLHLDLDDIAFAQVFTTQDTTWEMAAIADRIHGGLARGPINSEVHAFNEGIHFRAWAGTMWIPVWQAGEHPYLVEGGAFAFEGDDPLDPGPPILQGWERVEFSLTLPKDTEAWPAEGWPVAIYSHGTGGDRTTFCDEKDGMEVAAMFAKAGIAGFGISLPFHGDRNQGGDPALLSFNYFNPEAGRTNFRAAALDQVFLAAALAAEPRTFEAHDEDGEHEASITLDPDRVVYMGHSHGGEIGALAVPHFREAVQGVVLSGTGGGLSITLTSRDAGDFDIQGLLKETFDLEDDEFTETHPLAGLVQLAAEATDPINTGPFWSRWEPPFASSPQSVLMFEGLHDVYTPPRAIEALAGSAGIPIIDPVAQVWTVQELRDIDGVPTPLADNLVAWDGSEVTGGLSQYPDHGHFPVFEDRGAAELYQGFLSSALGGRAEIPER